MWTYELDKFLSKLIKAVLCGIFIGFSVKLVKNMNKQLKNEINQFNKKQTRLQLKKPKNYTREHIIKLGRQSIRCALTNEILIYPVVSLDWKSFEKKNIQDYIENYKKLPSGEDALNVRLYDNRAMRDFIEKCREIYVSRLTI